MTETPDKPAENTEKDRVSLKSNEESKSVKMLKRAVSLVTGTRGTSRADSTTSNDSGSAQSQPPPSPSLSTSSAATDSLKNTAGKKDEDEIEVESPKKILTRSKTAPNIPVDSLRRRLSFLGLGSKRYKEKRSPKEKNDEEEEEEAEEEEVFQEMEETDTLPDIPQTLLSGLSTGSAATDSLKNTAGKKDEDEIEVESPKKILTRSKTAPNITVDSLRRGLSFRLGLGSKRYKEKRSPNCQSPCKEKNGEEEEEKEEVFQEMEETYTLPDIPQTLLSVMEINKLIESGLLEEAHLYLLALRQEFQQELGQHKEDSPMELVKKEKDLNLLYGNLRSKIRDTVRDSNQEQLGFVARIIQEEEKRAKEPGGLEGSWMEAWGEAVDEGVQLKVDGIPQEQSVSWLAVHLGLLGKVIVEDLENVKRVLLRFYPPSFRVFSTYVKSYHRVVGQHLRKLEQRVTDLKDLYALQDWIINGYKSERIMGNASLQPDMKGESTDLQLEENFLMQLKNKYCSRLKDDLRSSLDRIIKLENDEVWTNSKSPEKEDGFPVSKFPMDIWTYVKGIVINSQKIDAQLEKKVTTSCLEELKHFPGRFATAFRSHCSALKSQPLWVEYNITYINSFTALQRHMEEYKDTCPDKLEEFRIQVKRLITSLMEVLENQFKEDVKPYLGKMMTKKWLTDNNEFDELYSRTDLCSHHCAAMMPPHAQEFANHLHYHVVKEYAAQLMMNNYSCKNRKHEKAAAKIREQSGKLGDLFENMKSTQEWLYHVGDDLSEIIGQKNKADIKDQLETLVMHYPDFSKKHLIAVLNFRGLQRGREYQHILQKFTELEKKLGSKSMEQSRVLFRDMQVTVNTNCLTNLPCSCVSALLQDN